MVSTLHRYEPRIRWRPPDARDSDKTRLMRQRSQSKTQKERGVHNSLLQNIYREQN